LVRNPWILATASTVALVGANEAYAAPVYNWTGFYIGVNCGAASHEATTNDLNLWGGLGTPPYVSPWFKSNTTSATFGGQAGYSWQMNYFVIGLEADVSYIGASQTFVPPENLVAAGCSNCFASATNELTWLSTFRGRGGFAVDRIFIYGTAGVAFGQVNNSWGWDNVRPFTNSFSVSETRAGFVAGGGIEAMLTPNVSLRAEYLHVDLGTSRSTITGQPNCCQQPGTFTTEFKNTADIGRVGLNWRW
jgi:outer membrane immunogenic protein